MLRKHFCLGAALLLSFTIGCGNKGEVTESPTKPLQENSNQNFSKQSSPEEAFASFVNLIEKNEWEQASVCLTDESQSTMCGAMIFISSFAAAFNPELKPEIEQLFEKYKIDPEKQMKVTPPKGSSQFELFQTLGSLVKEKPKFLLDVVQLLEKHSSKDNKSSFKMTGPTGDQSLDNVTITGDTATAIVTVNDEQKRLEFQKKQDKWYLQFTKEMFEAPSAKNKNSETSSYEFKEYDEFDYESGEEEELPAVAAMSLKEYNAVWQIDLDVKDQPCGEVIAKIAKQAGLKIYKPETHEELFQKPVTLKLEKISCVQALEQITSQLDYYPRYQLDKVTFTAGKRPFPVAFSGPFLITVDAVDEYVPYAAGELDVTFFAAGMPVAGIFPFTNLILATEKNPENRKQENASLLIKSIVGINNSNLLQIPKTNSWSSARVTKKTLIYNRGIDLINLVNKVLQIENVQGDISFSIPTQIETLKFEKLEEGETIEKQGVKLKLKKLKLGKQSTITVEYEGIREGQLKLLAFDEKGKALKSNGSWGFPASNGNNGSVSSYFGGKVASLSLQVTMKTEPLSYPFELVQIPLKKSEKMPATVPEIKFAGDSPVRVKFLKFAEENGQKQIHIEVKNISNRDIQSVAVMLDFLDANGKKLKDFPHTHSGSSNMIPAGKTYLVKASTFAMPEETKSISPRPWHVWFAGNAEWEEKSKF